MQDDRQDRLQIGQFAELVGLSIPQLRRYERLQLLQPEGRTPSGYRYYTHSQTDAGHLIALLRSIDMPIADIRQILSGVGETERHQLLKEHRARLESRLGEVRRLLDAVDELSPIDSATRDRPVESTSWLHFMPHLPVSDVDRSVAYYEGTLGFRLEWQTTDRQLTALASGLVELLLLVPWDGEGPPPSQSAYVYVDDPDALHREYESTGATILTPPEWHHGMRQFTVADPDGHRFILGCGDSVALQDAAEHYGLDEHDITANPNWLEDRSTRRREDAASSPTPPQ